MERYELSQALAEFEYERYQEMKAHWLVKGRMLWYVYGNLKVAQSKYVVEQAISLLSLSTMAKEELQSNRVVDLESQSRGFQRLDFVTPDATNANSCFVSYYQYGIEDRLNDGKVGLMNQLVMQFL